MAQNNTLNLKLGISYKDILHTILPIFIALSIPTISFVVNNIFISKIGQAEMGTGLIAGVYFLLFTAVGYGLNGGLQSILSRRAGEENILGISKTFFNGLCINVFISIAAIVFTYFITPIIMDYFLNNTLGKSNDTMEFLRIRMISLPFLLCIQLFSSFFISVNKAFYIVVITITTTVLNIFLDYSLIFGHFGFNAFGFNGAAYASVFADIIGFIVALGILFIFKFYKKYFLFKHTILNTTICKSIFKQSAPLIFQNFISIGSWLFFFFLVNNYGTEQSAISSIMRNMFAISTTLVWASGSATNTMVSNLIGQNKPDLVWPLIKRILLVCVGFTILMCIAMNVAPHLFIDLFDNNGLLYNNTLPVFRVISFVIIFMSVSCIFLNASTGTGNPNFNLKVECFAVICYLIYSSLAAKYFHLSLTYLWLNEFVYWSAILIIIYPFMLSNKWRNKQI